MPHTRLISLTKFEGIDVFVGNLPLEMTREELAQKFTPFGEIMSASVMNDRYIGSGQSRGYGYVKMAVRSQGEAAITGLNGKTFHHHIVSVIEAMALSPVNATGRHAGHYRQRNQA